MSFSATCKKPEKSVLWIVRVYKWVNDCSLWCEVKINGGKFSKDEVTECTVSAFFLYVQAWLTQLPCNSFLSIVYSLWQRERETERESGYGTERPRRRQGLSTSPRGISAMVSESASEQNFIPDLCHSYSLLYLPLTHLWLMYECVLICNGLEA